MQKTQLNIATCQFPISRDIEKNSEYIQDFIRQAAQKQADIVHFSETALSGYAGIDFKSIDRLDWQLLNSHSQKIAQLAKELNIWVILGSTHQLTPPAKPCNSLYLINPQGQVADRYDKRFLTELDLESYSPGNYFAIFNIKNVVCALLICFDLRFPELYRQLWKQGVNVVFQSFYNAKQIGPSAHNYIMQQTMQTNAANNHFWVSMSNTCTFYSPYASCFIEPDGKIAAQLEQNAPGIMVNTVDLSRQFYDPMVNFRQLAVNGHLNNGKICSKNDQKLLDRTSF